jgi:uncharacterized repeat protein (TIGR01451 family)
VLPANATLTNGTGTFSATLKTAGSRFIVATDTITATITGASANIAVVGPPTLAHAFNPPAIAIGEATSLTFTITNPAANNVALTGVAFTDTLPTGLTH